MFCQKPADNFLTLQFSLITWNIKTGELDISYKRKDSDQWVFIRVPPTGQSVQSWAEQLEQAETIEHEHEILF